MELIWICRCVEPCYCTGVGRLVGGGEGTNTCRRTQTTVEI